MDHCFSFHSVQLRETARNFFEKELAPHASDIDRDNEFPMFRVREVAKLATLVAEGGGVSFHTCNTSSQHDISPELFSPTPPPSTIPTN